MNNNVVIKEDQIENMIYEIRGKQVMLDSDLAKLYECKNGTKDINKAVKRNIERFPEDFYFQLSEEESSRFQFGTLNKNNNYRGSNIKYLHYAFTEQGIAMLSGILHTEVAVNTSIYIMRAFSLMKQYINNNLIEQKYINNQVLENTESIKKLQDTFDKFIKPEENNHIFFEGQIYDSYVLLLNIFDKSKKEIIITDNYVDKNLLNILSKTNKKVIVYSKNIDEELIKKYQKQYNNVDIIYCNGFHDRFIIIDKKVLYHSGASFKDLGNKCFAINKISDNIIINNVLKELDNCIK